MNDTNSQKQQIMNAALSIFSTKGYSGTTIAEIAALSRVNPATIYQYFKGKQDLFAALDRPDLNFPDADEQLIRRKIMQAALKIFSQKGFAAATMDDIAAAVGLSKAGVYFYYPTKENLFTSALENSPGFEKVNQVLQSSLSQADSDLETGLVLLAKTYLSFYLNEEFSTLLRIILSEGVHNAAISDAFKEKVVKTGSENVAAYLMRYCQLPPEILAKKVQALFGMLFTWGLMNCILADPNTIDDAMLEQTAFDYSHQFLYGIHESLKPESTVKEQK
jgi:AcrR family transcriptional regulator